MNSAGMKQISYDTIDVVTRKCYFDIEIDGLEQGRIVIGLFGNTVPVTARNFAELCSGVNGISKYSGMPLTYEGSHIHKIIKGFMMQGGDIITGTGSGGESIYNGTAIPHENYKIKHSRKNLVSMVNSGRKSYTSQFFITFRPDKWLDGKNVVVGEVIEGLGVLKVIQDMALDVGEKLLREVKIVRSGELPV